MKRGLKDRMRGQRGTEGSTTLSLVIRPSGVAGGNQTTAPAPPGGGLLMPIGAIAAVAVIAVLLLLVKRGRASSPP